MQADMEKCMKMAKWVEYARLDRMKKNGPAADGRSTPRCESKIDEVN
jgi:hypothetical protein